jgi:hypothetical protein
MVSTLFELLVYKYMYEDLKGQLADCQNDFIKGRSTVSNLLGYSSFDLKSIEEGCESTRIFLRPLVRCVIVCFWIKC